MPEPHDFNKNPELFDSQMAELYFSSPHKQIFDDFDADVVNVHDGDTLTVKWSERDFPFRIRFSRIDTKELSSDGNEAKEWVKNRLMGEHIRVLIDPNNRVGKFGRIIGDIIHRGMSISDQLLQIGLAVPFEDKNKGKLINPIKNIEGIVAWP